jgi:hypothetical protein
MSLPGRRRRALSWALCYPWAWLWVCAWAPHLWQLHRRLFFESVHDNAVGAVVSLVIPFMSFFLSFFFLFSLFARTHPHVCRAVVEMTWMDGRQLIYGKHGVATHLVEERMLGREEITNCAA